MLAIVFRGALAEFGLKRWCAGKGLVCHAEITSLTPDRLVAREIEIRSQGDVPFSARDIEADLTWSGLFSPGVTAITVSEPVLRARFDGETLTAHGLETLVSSGGQEASASPDLNIQNAALELSTPAGSVVARGEVTGRWPGSFSAAASVDPLALQSGEDRLVADTLTLRLMSGEAGVSGVLSGEIALANLGAFELAGAILDADMTGDAGGPANLNWQVSVDRLRYGETEADGLRSSGLGALEPGAVPTLDGLQAGLLRLAAEAEVTRLRSGRLEAGETALSLDLTRQTAADFAGPVELDITDLTDPLGRVREARFEGELAGRAAGEDSLSGRLRLSGAEVTAQTRAAWLSALEAPSPFARHAAAWRGALSAALEDVDAEVDLTLAGRDGEGIRLETRGAPRFDFASGLALAITPTHDTPVLSYRPDALRLAGDVALSGGGGPSVAVEAADLRRTGAGLALLADRARLADWRVDGLSLGIDLSELAYGDEGGGAVGTLRLDGAALGARFDDLQLGGRVVLARRAEGVSVETAGDGCLRLAMDGLSFAALTLGRVNEQICPRGGRLLAASTGVPAGGFDLDRLVLPVASRTFSGDVTFGGLAVDWRADRGLALDLRADTLAAPLRFTDRVLEASGGLTRVDVRAGNGPTAIDLTLQDARFDGDLIPARITSERFNLDVEARSDGLTGSASVAGVVIADRNADPLFKRLGAELSARISAGTVDMSGPLSVKRTGDPLGDLTMTLDLSTLSGTARAETGTLFFAPGSLQPHTISERLRGAFPDATGTLESTARFTIDRGSISGTGRVIVSEFGFQTQALGRVSGVSGVVAFDDLIALTTPPQQAVTIASIDPGIPLTNGRLEFQLLGPREARLDEAVWPFAGGKLRVAPTVWRLGDVTRTVTVAADRIDLARVVEVLAARDIEVEGTVSGVFPLELDSGSTYVRGARLVADEKGGVVRYSGAAADQATAAANNESVSLAFQALQNLEYTVLEVGADGNLLGEMVVTLRLVGRNEEVAYGTPFAFNIAVDSELSKLLAAGQRATSSDWLADAVIEQVQGGADRSE